MKLKLVSTTIILVIFSGCTTSQGTFVKKSAELSNLDVCQNYMADGVETFAVKSVDDEKKKTYLASLQEQFLLRGLTESKCQKMTKDHASKMTGLAVAGVAAAAIGYKIYSDKKDCEKNYKKCKSNGSGGGYTPQKIGSTNSSSSASSSAQIKTPNIKSVGVKSQPLTTIDVYGNPKWDYFYDDYGEEIRRCRNQKNGQFVSNANCVMAPDNDNTWPDK